MPTVSLPISLLAAVIVLLLPGGALLAWFHPHAVRRGLPDPINGLVDASALSISIAALVGLAGNLLGLHFSGPLVAGLYGLSAALLIGGLVWRNISGAAEAPRPARLSGLMIRGLLALVLAGALFAWRLYQARGLALPPWVDSVHHTLVTRIILENGGIPSSLEPYLPVPLVFHYGFQLSTALFAFWSGAPPEQAVLWFGQLLNALVALAVYRAATVFPLRWGEPAPEAGGSPWRAALKHVFPLTAALLVGFAFQMPAYYLTWGRFTLLAGLLLLGPTLAAAMDAWTDYHRADAWLRLVLLIAGLGLTHILALLLAAFFLALLGLAAAARILIQKEGWPFLWRLVVFGLLGLLLAAPWLIYTVTAGDYQVNSLVTVSLDTSETAQQKALEYLKYFGYLTGPRRSHILFGIAGVGLLAALAHPRRRFLAGWAVLLVVFALPWGTRSSPFRADYFAIILFFPAAMLAAGLLVDCAVAVGRVARPWAGGLALMIVAGTFVGWGIWQTRTIINPVTVIATTADARALEWVNQNTPADARFYINNTLWLGGTYRGVDGGYWLLPFTGRYSLVPPAFYVWGSKEYVTRINDWAARSAEVKGCTPEFWQIVREANLTHVYLREGIGSLQPANLIECPRLQVIYQEQGVFIYSVLRP